MSILQGILGGNKGCCGLGEGDDCLDNIIILGIIFFFICCCCKK